MGVSFRLGKMISPPFLIFFLLSKYFLFFFLCIPFLKGRFSFFTFTGDLTVRVDTTSAWLGQLFMSLSQFGCQQNFMQRYVSLKSTTEVKR